jgi:hypothetical protein
MGAALHLRLSLVGLASFAALGLVLEGIYGLRLADFIDDPIRREFLRLGHAHGAVLALLNVGLAWAIERRGTPAPWARAIRVAALVGAVVVAGGFLGGGAWHGPTDPGPMVLLVPAGALLVIGAVLAAARGPGRE